MPAQMAPAVRTSALRRSLASPSPWTPLATPPMTSMPGASSFIFASKCPAGNEKGSHIITTVASGSIPSGHPRYSATPSPTSTKSSANGTTFVSGRTAAHTDTAGPASSSWGPATIPSAPDPSKTASGNRSRKAVEISSAESR